MPKYFDFVQIPGAINAKAVFKLATERGHHLGYLRYHMQWKQYIFAPAPNCIFSFDCLEAITAKLKELNHQQKGAK
jgi:hypothetical protein